MAISIEERRRRDRERAKEKVATKAIAEGRTPGRTGRPPVKRSVEEKELIQIAANRRRTLATLTRKARQRAERAISEGREPGKVGQPRVLSDEQRKQNRLATFARYREKNLDICRKRSVKSSKQRRDRLRIENPEMYRLQTAASRAHMNAKKYGIPRNPESLTAIVNRVWQSSGGKCAACPSTDRLELDHKVALIRGGTNAEDNLQFLCRACNASKSDLDWAEWLASRAPSMEILL